MKTIFHLVLLKLITFACFESYRLKTSISYSRIWRIAYPIIIGSVAQNIINVTDTAFLGHLGEIALGGGAIGGLFYITIVMLGWGFGVGTQIAVSRRNGEQQYRQIGRTIEHGFLFLMALALLIFTVVQLFGSKMLMFMVDSQNVFIASQDFLKYRIWGIFFAHTNFLFRAFYVGIARTKVITLTTLIMVAVNVVLDYGLIFGELGLPQMGVAGAALASVIAEASCALAFIAYTFFKIPRKKYRLFSFKVFSFPLLWRTLKTSIPIMIQNFISFAIWFVFFLYMEKMGESELAVSNILRSIYIILMIPIMGFSSATNSLVSFVIGEGRSDEVLGLIRRIMMMSASGVLFIVINASLFANKLILVYTFDEHLISMAVPLIYLISCSSVLLSIANILFNGVSGTGKTNVSLTIESVAILVYFGYIAFVVGYLKGSIFAAWMVEVVYGILLALISFAYLRSKRWVGAKV